MNSKKKIAPYGLALCFTALFLMALPLSSAHADFAATMKQAWRLHKSSHYLAAAGAYQRAIQQGNQEKGQHSPIVLRARIDLADVLYQADQRREAHRQHEANYRDISDAFGADYELSGYAQALLGLSWYRMGDLVRALENMREAHSTLENTTGIHASFVPVLTGMIAHVLEKIGRRDESIQWTVRALKLLEAMPASDEAAKLRQRHMFISLQSNAYITPELLRMQEELLTDVRKLRGDRHIDTLQELRQLSKMYYATKDWATALRFSEEELALLTSLQGQGAQQDDTLQSIRYNMGLAEMRLGHLPRARELLYAATVAQERKLGPRHNDTLMSLAQLARTCNLQSDYKTAAKLGGELITRIEALREQRHLPPESLRHYFARWAGAYKVQAHSLVQLKDFAQAFKVMELARARGLREAASLYEALEGQLLTPDEKNAWEDARLRLVAAEAEVAAAEFASVERLRLEKSRDVLASDFSALRAKTEANNQRLRDLSRIEVPTWNDLSGKLGAGVVYISFALDEDILLVMGVSRERGSVVSVANTGNGLQETIYAFRLLLQLRGGLQTLEKSGYTVVREADDGYRLVKSDEAGARLRADADEVGAWLGDKLLSGILAKFPEAKRLAISPDQLLSLVPLEAMRLDGRYLIEQLEVLYTPSAEILLKTAGRMRDYRRLARPKDLLAIGGAIYHEMVPVNPLFSMHHSLLDLSVPPPGLEQEVPPHLGEMPPQLGAATSVKQALSSFRGKWQNLPATVDEIQAVADMFDRDRHRVMTYSMASEAHLRELDRSGELADYRYLLFSTHGYLNLAEPSLTAIVLSQIGADEQADGFLTVGELPLYRLKSDLVFVSACDSGLGRVFNGDGIAGLSYALFLAGNTNSVVTLWPILDRPSGEFSKQFFSKLREGKDQVTALAEVKRYFLRSQSLREPMFWAGFVLYGV
ncbi:MAG: hypothetical protein A2505_00195 [Deltaproteobacteria bacterium RIFOXYD12_FULL_55_16]|nr:MAG: hypothetical protein A2505_00195 [Deltaproteobacteria bacterium RIFOXYD12_FULL_55_16]